MEQNYDNRLEEILDNTRLWNAYVMFLGLGLRITSRSGLNQGWLRDKIKEVSSYKDIHYEELESLNGHPFNVPILRLKCRKQKKKILLQAIHGHEWAATESILRFADDWGRNKISQKVKESYDITIIPLLSIDKFPDKYGSNNLSSDTRFETIKHEIDSSDLIIEMHESPLKNQFLILLPFIYPSYKLVKLLGKYYYNYIDTEGKQETLEANLIYYLKNSIADVEIMFSNSDGLIEKITENLHGFDISLEESCESYSRRISTKEGKPTYGIELYSDWGMAGEGIALFFTGMLAYPFTEISTYLNRTFRKEKIKHSRLQAAENGRKTIHSILEAYL
ncbi:hypothetical protein J4214_02385 [Candidatus Woesearchaeota archaeon]|nr:hypothetical protein [Candidatus Woesearchaeota archaeon]